MNPNTDRYELPESTDRSIRGMWLGLTAFLVALLILVALLFYYSPVIAKKIPFSAEQRFVRPYEKMIGKFFADETGDPAVQQYLQNLADDLHLAMALPEAIELKVHYIEMDEANAFATLGGHIVLFSGLLDVLPDENSIVMVLAHEIAHVKNRDPVASMGRGMALQMIFGFFTAGGASGDNLLNLSGNLSEGVYSREQEKQADLAALIGLVNHYGHAGGYRTFFDQFDQNVEPNEEYPETDLSAGLGRFSEWFSSHPKTQDRIEYLDAEVERMNTELKPGQMLPREIRDSVHSGSMTLSD